MHAPHDHPDLAPRELAELSALADGTLDPARRAEVESKIAASPELTALYERERRVVELVHEAASSVRAPAGLRARIEASRPTKPVRARRRLVYGGSLAGALAAAVLALVLILPGGAPGAPSVSQAAALAVLGASGPAPAPNATTPGKLGVNVQQLYFPNWARLHWPATGQRIDRINGRNATTVYYGRGPRTVAYTIVDRPALKPPAGARMTVVNGVKFFTFTLNGRAVVSWWEDGHTCVLSSATAPAFVLRLLAAHDS